MKTYEIVHKETNEVIDVVKLSDSEKEELESRLQTYLIRAIEQGGEK